MKVTIIFLFSILSLSCVQKNIKPEVNQNHKVLENDTFQIKDSLNFKNFGTIKEKTYVYATRDSLQQPIDSLSNNIALNVYFEKDNFLYVLFKDDTRFIKGWVKQSDLKPIYLVPPNVVN